MGNVSKRMSRSGIGFCVTAVACAQQAASLPANLSPPPAQAQPTVSPTSTGSASGTAGSPHATLAPDSEWKCPFPEAADKAAVDDGVVLVVVTVASTGQAVAVEVLQDPGYGFGAAARTCFLAQKYIPARNSEGNAVQGTTRPIRVRFAR